MLQGKRILVTGGSRGLGRALVARFLREGARVAYTYVTRPGESPGALSFQASVTDEKAMTDVVARLEKEWEGLDVLVNNAGVSEPLPFSMMDREEWDWVIRTNLDGMYVATRAALPSLIRRKAGTILNIGSLAGVRQLDAPVHYCASKAAVKGFTESLAKEMAKHGIRVVNLAPGLLTEGMSQDAPEYKTADYVRNLALRRLGDPDEAASWAAFLISDRNSYMTGATVVVDGGF